MSVRRTRDWVTLSAAVTSGLTSAGAYAVAARLPASARARWERTNHAGATVTLLEGPAHVLGLAGGGLLAGGAAGISALAALGAGAFGALDDLTGDTRRKGLKGHLQAATRGEVTTGLIKIAGLGLVGLGAAAALERTPRHGRGAGLVGGSGRAAGAGRTIDVLLGAGVIAGTANLLNLFDLRPGRALKVGLVLSAPVAVGGGAGSTIAASAVGAALGSLGPDLRGESMLGDTGANALGAVIGTAWLAGTSRSRRTLLLVGLTVLTLASERVSFTKVIERTPVLRELDAWGRPSR